ncbi:MAG: depupylase/deamidase Dop [Acidimicrobiia bacterium]
MALPKVLGTETEFGIHVAGDPDFNPSLASSLVVNALVDRRHRVGWSYDHEMPRRDARSPVGEGFAPESDAAAVNVVLTNGARFYVDHAHPEYSAPETIDPRDAALYDKAGELVGLRAARAASSVLGEGQRVALYKNNTDGKGASYGAHENVLLDRRLGFGRVIAALPTFLVTRQLVSGSGKVGDELGRGSADFQITQRADHFEEVVGLETTLRRPLVNTRDEPHADERYRRLHVIVGDATMSEVQTWVKLGSLSAFLAALEDDAIPDDLTLANPVEACWAVSRDLDLDQPLLLASGRTATALELQAQYLGWVREHWRRTEDPGVGAVLTAWEKLLADLEADPRRAADRLDWAAKLVVAEGYLARGIGWDDPKLAAVNLQYHDLDPDRGLYHRLVARGRMSRLFTDEEVATAADEPPGSTRAYFRGRCVDRFGTQLVAANWDSLIFDTGADLLRRVPMLDPLKGTEALTAALIDGSADAAALLEALRTEA